jgi:release factor glutamine methyltransferase
VSTEALAEVWTVRRVLTWTQQRFAQSGLDSPRLDAEVLLSHCLGKTRVGLYLCFEQPLHDGELADFRALIRRRLAGEPVAYLIGQREFYSLALHVSPSVLIPRPETELLVEEALRRIDEFRREKSPVTASQPADGSSAQDVAEADSLDVAPLQAVAEPGVPVTVEYDSVALEADEEPASPSVAADSSVKTEKAVPESETEAVGPALTVVDVGTGSGAIALAVKHERPSVKMIAIDRSPDALAVAKQNAETLSVSVEFVQSDLLGALTEESSIDLLLANLPYIPTADMAGLSKDVLSEPHLALDGGVDGLQLVARLVEQAPRRLRPGGSILLEIGQGQAPTVESMLRRAGFVDVRSEKDLAGIERLVCGRVSALVRRPS